MFTARQNPSLNFIFGTSLIFLLSSCGHKSTNTDTPEAQNKIVQASAPATNTTALNTTEATVMSGGSNYALISFPKSSDQVSENARETLKKLMADAAKESRSIKEVEVLAWADREYPAKKANVPKKEIAEADHRGKMVRRYLKDTLKVDARIRVHNMAERPGLFSELMRSDDFKIKKNFEETDAAPSTVVGNAKPIPGGKASKALVFIKYR